MDSSRPLPGHSIVSWRALILSDVISVVATPTACGASVRCLLVLDVAMLARLSRLLGRQKGEHNETRGRQKEAGLQPQCRTSRHKWFWGKRRSTGQTSTPNSVTGQEQRMNKVATLTLQLQMMTQERNELCGILANYTNKDLNNRLNFELEMLNMEHKKVMLDLQKFRMEMREALYKCKELTEENVSYSTPHNQLLSERTQLKKKVSMLREENRKLWREQISLQESCEKVKNLYEETDEKICELCDMGDKKQDLLVERRQSLLKLRDLVTNIELAEKLQNPYAVSQMSSALEN